jgi:hypothetical protein
MHLNKTFILFWILVIYANSCIVPFEPDIESRDINKYVVSGQITDISSRQIVTVSIASSVTAPKNIPVSGCYVRIFDTMGHEFAMSESDDGVYETDIDCAYLIHGNSFRVDILTPDGTNIESDFDQMNECPEIDTIYFMRRDIKDDLSSKDTKIIQFYLDVDGRNTKSRYFKWEVFETWEYHVEYPIEWYYDGRVHHVYPPDYSRKVCWSTKMTDEIYVHTTANLVENRYIGLPLNNVDNQSNKLIHGYSMLVYQYAMSETAYQYWDQMRSNSYGQGGLFEKQPLSIVGNLHNKTDPSQKVLGFFSASCAKSKRIFIDHVENFEIDFAGYCNPFSPRYGFKEVFPNEYPLYLMGDEDNWYMIFLNDECVDCLSIGGTNVKPDFWPY